MYNTLTTNTVTLARVENCTLRHFSLSAEQLLTVPVTTFNIHTKRPVAAGKAKISSPMDVHFFASDKYPNYYYVAQWVRRHHKYVCGCPDSKQGYCSHLAKIETVVVA